jgi:hypothetical protein
MSSSSSVRSTTGSLDGSPPPPVPPSIGSPSSVSSSSASAAVVVSSLSHLLPNLSAFDSFLQQHEHSLRQELDYPLFLKMYICIL